MTDSRTPKNPSSGDPQAQATHTRAAVRSILLGCVDNIASDCQGETEIDDAHQVLNLGYYEADGKLAPSEARTIAGIFSRLPEAARAAVLGVLASQELGAAHKVALMELKFASYSIGKYRRQKRKVDLAEAMSGDDGPPLTKSEMPKCFKQRCPFTKEPGVPVSLVMGELSVRGFVGGNIPMAWNTACWRLRGERPKRLAAAIVHQATLTGFARQIRLKHKTKQSFSLSDNDIYCGTKILGQSGLVLCQKRPDSAFRWEFTLLGLFSFKKHSHQRGTPGIRTFYNGVQLLEPSGNLRRDLVKPVRVNPDEKFIGGPWMCGVQPFWFSKRIVRTTRGGRTSSTDEYRAYLGDAPMPEPYRALVHLQRKAKAGEDVWKIPADELEAILSAVDYWEPTAFGATRPSIGRVLNPYSIYEADVPRMPECTPVETIAWPESYLEDTVEWAATMEAGQTAAP